MVIRLQTLCAILVSFLFFFFSLLVFPYFDGGDQEFYRAFYEGVHGLPLRDAFRFYQDSLGSSEPGYFLFVYVVSSFASKDLVFSCVNSVFVFLVLRHLLAADVRIFVLVLLACNFYLFVLFFSAERLKFSLLLFLLGSACVGTRRYGWFLASVLTHAQTLILLMVVQVRRFLTAFRSLLLGVIGFDFAAVFIVFAGLLVVFWLMSSHILLKMAYYYNEWGGLGGVVKPAIFSGLAIWCSEKKVEALIASFIIVILSLFFGSERLTIFSYFVFMYYAIGRNGGMNIAVVATSVFYAVKGVLFMWLVFEYGDGFYVAAS